MYPSTDFTKFRNATWTQENGYRSVLAENYPRHLFGGILGGAIKFILRQESEDIEPFCSPHTGFKVKYFKQNYL